MCNLPEESGLEELFHVQQDVAAKLAQFAPAMEHYFSASPSVISRHPDSPTTGGIENATCTAFGLYYVAKIATASLAEVQPGAAPIIEKPIVTSMTESLGKMIIEAHTPGKATATTVLPNQYNSVLQVAGYLRSSRYLGLKAIDVAVLNACADIVEFILNATTRIGQPYASRIRHPDVSSSTASPSSYLTYWAVNALREWLHVPQDSTHGKRPGPKNPEVTESLASLVTWSEMAMSQQIAYYHGRLLARFDAVELIYSAASCMRHSELQTEERSRLSTHALAIIFSDYFANGCIIPSDPAFSDTENRSIFIPTTEALSALMLSQLDLFIPHIGQLRETVGWLTARGESTGWSSEREGRHVNPSAFMTLSSLVFLRALTWVLDRALSRGAATALGVPAYAHSDELRDIPYPGDLETITKRHFIYPRSPGTPESLRLAAYSMILYGPPGTSKTTIAKKLANDLKWPLLVVNQSDFLRLGVDKVDAEAHRIFSLAAFLRDVVILFDEVEELVVSRGELSETVKSASQAFAPIGHNTDKLSRLLTTSMLPRLHYLRDRMRVVFIFATNHLNTIDAAAARLGRFDVIRCVLPPTGAALEKMVDTELVRLDNILGGVLTDRFRGTVKREIASANKQFTYLEIREVARQLGIAIKLEGKRPGLPLVKGILKNVRCLSEELVKQFMEDADRHDRP